MAQQRLNALPATPACISTQQTQAVLIVQLPAYTSQEPTVTPAIQPAHPALVVHLHNALPATQASIS